MKSLSFLLPILFLPACTETAPPVIESTPAVAPVVKQAPKKAAQPIAKRVEKPVKQGAITSLDIGQVFTMKESGKAVVIDVRPPLYYRLGHINGAESMPLIKYDKIIAAKRPQLDAAVKAGKVIVLYCQNSNCPDAHKTAVKLSKLGYSTSVFRGGWEAWKQAGME